MFEISNRSALKIIYVGLIGSVLLYGCIIYESASKTLLKKGGYTPVSGLETVLWRHQDDSITCFTGGSGGNAQQMVALTCWGNLRGHNENHPNHSLLKPSQEKEGQMLSYSVILRCPNLDSRRSKSQLKTVTNGQRKKHRQKIKLINLH